jgi:hypothetical protein
MSVHTLAYKYDAGVKRLTVVNTPTYSMASLITTIKKFIVQCTGPNVIKLFTAANYERS